MRGSTIAYDKQRDPRLKHKKMENSQISPQDICADTTNEARWITDMRDRIHANKKLKKRTCSTSYQLKTNFSDGEQPALPLPITMPKGLVQKSAGEKLNSDIQDEDATVCSSIIESDKYTLVYEENSTYSKDNSVHFNESVQLDHTTDMITFVDPDPRKLYLKALANDSSHKQRCNSINDKNSDEVNVNSCGTDTHSMMWWGLQSTSLLKSHLSKKLSKPKWPQVQRNKYSSCSTSCQPMDSRSMKPQYKQHSHHSHQKYHHDNGQNNRAHYRHHYPDEYRYRQRVSDRPDVFSSKSSPKSHPNHQSYVNPLRPLSSPPINFIHAPQVNFSYRDASYSSYITAQHPPSAGDYNCERYHCRSRSRSRDIQGHGVPPVSDNRDNNRDAYTQYSRR